MPNIKSAKKRVKLSREANARNRARRSELRTTMKRVRDAAKPEDAAEKLKDAYALLDRAARTRLLHPNKVSRLKGQLARHVESLTA